MMSVKLSLEEDNGHYGGNNDDHSSHHLVNTSGYQCKSYIHQGGSNDIKGGRNGEKEGVNVSLELYYTCCTFSWAHWCHDALGTLSPSIQ